MIKYYLNKSSISGKVAWTGLVWLMVGTCECGNEPPVSIECEECIDYLKTF